jgi:hypothetical protein
LVWLGRPANTASKLTDLANKPAETKERKVVSVAYNKPVPNYASPLPGGLGSLGALTNPFQGALSPLAFANALSGDSSSTDWEWKTETLEGFLSNVRVEYVPPRLVHNNPNFVSLVLMDETQVVRAHTPPILMTASVWKGFRSDRPEDVVVKNGLIKRVYVKTPGYTDAVFGGDVIFPNLRD